MTWTKLGDEFSDECWTLSDAAYRLHTEGLLWSNRMTTDGQLAKDDMRRWARHPEAAEELVSIGWWEDHGGHYQIIHHIGYQRTKEQIAHQSIVNQKNAARRWKKPSKDKPSNDSQCDSHSGSTSEMDRTGQDRPGEGDQQQKSETQKKKKPPPDPTTNGAGDHSGLCTNGCDSPAGFSAPGSGMADGVFCEDCAAHEGVAPRWR